MKHACGWDKWLAPGQPDNTPGLCNACGLNMTYGGVKRCLLKRGGAVADQEKPIAQRWVSLTDLSRDSAQLASMLSGKVDCIIGVARSGLTPATIVATLLHLPLFVLRESEGDIVDAGHGWRLKAKQFQSPVVIDDTSCSGRSLGRIKKVVESSELTPKYAVVYYDRQSKESVDYFVKELPRPHVMEWNIANSVYSSQMLWDMDGVICEDCPNYISDDEHYAKWLDIAKPKCLPLRSKIRIVTGRREMWRPQTEAWLARHGVQAELIMHPDGERTGESVIEHKANAVSKYATGPVAMLESDKQQAMRIQEITGKSVWYVGDGPVVETKQKPQKTVTTVPAVQETRVDWFEDYPCTYRAGEPQKKTCGCGGTGVVYVMDCTETTGMTCVATELQRKGLLKKHPDLYHSVRVCEDCPLAKVVPVALDLPAGQSPSH